MDGYDEDLSIVCCHNVEEPDEWWLDFLNWIKESLDN